MVPGRQGPRSANPRGVVSVVWILLMMLLIMALAAVVVLYTVFPHRGQEIPRAPWLGEAMRQGVNRLPTLDNQREWQDH